MDNTQCISKDSDRRQYDFCDIDIMYEWTVYSLYKWVQSHLTESHIKCDNNEKFFIMKKRYSF